MQFETHVVDEPSQAGPLGSWLATCARKDTPVALAVRDRSRKLALATLEDAWVIDLKSAAGPIASAVLRSQLLEQAQVKLLSRNLSKDVQEFSQMMAPLWGIKPLDVYRVIGRNFVGDLTTAAHCINQVVTPPNKFRQLEHAAYEIALICPQYETGIAPYYERIGIPLARLIAEAAMSPKAQPEWWVTYYHMWVKVLAAYTGDPTLCWALSNQRDPFEAAATVFKSSKEDAWLMLLWQACGRDPFCFSARFPHLVKNLPENPKEEWGDLLNRGLPALTANCDLMVKAYYEDRQVLSLFKRKLRPGNPIGEAVAFRVFGTVEELINIAAVTFWQNRSGDDTLIRKYEGGPAEDTIRVLGTGPREGKHQWIETVQELAPLANPLNDILLRPIVTLAPQS